MNYNTLLSLTALLLLSGASHGQASGPGPVIGPNQAVTDLTRQMSNRLHLNEGQYIKLASINRIRLAQQSEIERATASDPAARTTQLAELQMQYEQECARILTPSQLSLMQQESQDQSTATSTGGQG